MPVHDLGYRSWLGTRSESFLRPLVVARGGISLVFNRRWIRLMVMMAWLPMVLPAIGIFFFEFSSGDPEMVLGFSQFLRGPMGRPDLAVEVLENPEAARHGVWSLAILAFFRVPQLFAMVVLIGLIMPMLVSYDLRTKAYLMYFSRPLTPTGYIVGKSAVIWILLGMVITLPALGLYVIGVFLSPDFSVIGETWDIPLKILAASVVLVVPTTMLAMVYSSLTSESRYATFAWFSTWIMGMVAYQILTFTSAAVVGSGRRGGPGPGGPGPRGRRGPPVDWEEMGVDLDRWRWLSPYHLLGKVEAWVFGLDSTSASAVPFLIFLVALTALGFWMVRRRLVARLSV